jgi:hypothetical protein
VLPRIGSLVFLASFAVLLLFCAPGVHLGDSGELTTAAFTLGVAHETGFTLFCLLGKLVSLVPLGEVAFRLNLLSSLSGAATAWGAYRVVRDVQPTPGPTGEASGVGAAALVLSGLTFFRSSTVAEVYAPTAAAIALGLWLFQRARTGDRRAALGLALLGGLSLGLHAQLRILLGPPVLLWSVWRLRRRDRWPLFAPAAIALGAAVVAYLPLRAARTPYADWADPRTLGGVVGHLSASRIRAAFAGEMGARDPVVAWTHLRQVGGLLEGQLGLLALLAAALGLGLTVAQKPSRGLGVVLLAVGLGDLAYSVTINPMGIADLQTGAPLALVLAIGVGLGVAAAARRAGRAAPFVAGALGVLVCVPAALADGAGKTGLAAEPIRWTRAALAEAPPRALLLTTSDDLSAGLMYEQAVAGARPDVTALVRQQLWDPSLVGQRVAHAGDELRPSLEALRYFHRTPEQLAAHDAELLHALTKRELPLRAILWEAAGDAPPVPLDEVEAAVPLFVLHDAPVALPPARPLAEGVEQLLQPGREPFVRRTSASVLSTLGRFYLERGDAVRADGFFETALSVRPGDAAAATNLAVVRAQRGDLRAAADLVEEALVREPLRATTRLNAARYHFQLGELDAAERHFRWLLARDPHNAAARAGLAKVEEKRK